MLLNPLVLFFVRWFAILTFCGLGSATLQCCGSMTQSKNDALAVELALPSGEDASLFWFGVTKRALKLSPEKGDPTTLAWESGQNLEMDLHEGDKIEFLGSDDKGRLLVTGDVTVGSEKKATIPLRRV